MLLDKLRDEELVGPIAEESKYKICQNIDLTIKTDSNPDDIADTIDKIYKEGNKESESLEDNNKEFDYKHKLILAKKALSSNCNSPVQSNQGLDPNSPIEHAPRSSSQLAEGRAELTPESPNSSSSQHLNQPAGMKLCADPSTNKGEDSPIAGPSRVKGEYENKESNDEGGESNSNWRRHFESEGEGEGEEEDDGEKRQSKMPSLLSHFASYEGQKQFFRDHILHKYFDTCKSLSNNGHVDQKMTFKQEPTDTYQAPHPKFQDLPQIPGFNLEGQLGNFFSFLPQPSLAQQQRQQQQMLYEFHQLKSQKDQETKPHVERRNVFCCHICSFVGSSEEDFNNHMSQHFEHQCPHCTYSSRTEGRLKRHIKDFHSNENDTPYTGQQKTKSSTPKRTCRYCKFYTYDQVEFWLHLKKHIKPEKLLECPHCEFVTELKHHLEYHIRVHIGSKPFKCPKCNYSCVNKSMLNSHMKSHTNVYQFRCRDCNYATKYSHSLKLHLLKKKHHADVVLNSDGSMPTDGSGHFDVVNRRGPPRGPRLVRTRPDPSYSPTLSLNDLGYSRESPSRVTSHLDDPRIRALHDRDSLMWSEMRHSRSPSEMSGASKEDHFNNEAQHGNNLATSFSTYSRILSSQQFNCCFCTERFVTSTLLKEHVENVHLNKVGFVPYCQRSESSFTGMLPQHLNNNHNVGRNHDAIPTKIEPIGEGFNDEIASEGAPIPLDLSSGSKRKAMDDIDSSNTLSPSSEQGFQRKRSRKGRAFKLNTEQQIGEGDNWASDEGVDSQATEETMQRENGEEEEDGDEEEREKKVDSPKNIEETKSNELPSTSTDDVVGRKWKNDDAVVDNSPKSDSSGEGMLHSSDREEQKPTPFSVTSSSLQKLKYNDLKVDSSWHICRHCEMAFADQMTHRLHMGYHGYYNPFQCNGCGENCVDAFDFMLHLMCKAHS